MNTMEIVEKLTVRLKLLERSCKFTFLHFPATVYR